MGAPGRLSGMPSEWMEQLKAWMYSPEDNPEEQMRKVELYKLAVLDVEWELFQGLPRSQRTAESIMQRLAAAGPKGMRPNELRLAVRREAYASVKEVNQNLQTLLYSERVKRMTVNDGKRGRPEFRYVYNYEA